MFQRVVYRIVPNHACNDFNREPKLIKLKYFNENEEAVGVFKNIMDKAERYLSRENKELMRIMKIIKVVV